MSVIRSFLIVNVIGGVAVLGGYAGFLSVFPEQRDSLWGGIEGGWQSVFVISMFGAAAGYLIFTCCVLFRSAPTGFSSRLMKSKQSVSTLSAVFLGAAAVWMPATITYLDTGSLAWWIIAVASLWITALALVAMTAIVVLSPSAIPSPFARIMAIVGISYITFHCLVFDAIVWVSLFNHA